MGGSGRRQQDWPAAARRLPSSSMRQLDSLGACEGAHLCHSRPVCFGPVRGGCQGRRDLLHDTADVLPRHQSRLAGEQKRGAFWLKVHEQQSSCGLRGAFCSSAAPRK